MKREWEREEKRIKHSAYERIEKLARKPETIIFKCIIVMRILWQRSRIKDEQLKEKKIHNSRAI